MSLSTYLGNPLSTNGMQAIPTPEPGGQVGNRGVSTNISRASVAQQLISGGAAVQRKRYTKRGYSIGWSILNPAEVDLLMSFFDGRQGGGPYCLMDPSFGNQLPANVSGMGSVLGALPEWSPTAGALATSTSAGPGLLSGVAAWTGAATGSILYMGLNNVVDGTWLPPIIAGLSVRASIWAKVASGSGTLTAAAMYGIGGSAPAGTAATGTGVVLSSTWQEVSVGVASSFSWPTTSDYVMPKFTISSATSPSLLLSAPAFVYSDATSASALSPWVAGAGVPRCLVLGDVPSPVDVVGFREWTMTLQEA